MDRREFLYGGIGGALGAEAVLGQQDPAPPFGDLHRNARQLFPGIQGQVFLNAAGGTPRGAFAEAGLRHFEASWSRGHSGTLGEVLEIVEESRVAFAELIGARPEEIALVHCTKAGEGIVLDGLPALRSGGNVVTNDLHFSGSLHNLIGLRQAGLDVRIVRNQDWDVPLDAMRAAIDDRTALVAVTHVSNVNGRIEPLPELCEIAHARGALVYADIIQSAGIVPIDVRALGIDFAACSAYKWLFGTHGVGFLYVRSELQGIALEDRRFPGHARASYAPWAAGPDREQADREQADREQPDREQADFSFTPPLDASRYQPGHPSYLGYCAAREGLAFVRALGVERSLEHSVQLNARLRERLDAARYPCISPHVERSPIIAFQVSDMAAVEEALAAADIRVSLGSGRMRVSPSVYNREQDVDRLVKALHEA